MFGIIPQESSTFFFFLKTGSLIGLELTNLASLMGQQAQGFAYLPLQC